MQTITITHERFHVSLDQINAVRTLLVDADMPNDDRGTVAVTIQRPSIQASAPLATEADVRNQIELGGPINDSAALSIAAWYASARGQGLTFNELATGRPVPVDELLDAIQAERETAPHDTLITGGADLEALARWVKRSTDEN